MKIWDSVYVYTLPNSHSTFWNRKFNEQFNISTTIQILNIQNLETSEIQTFKSPVSAARSGGIPQIWCNQMEKSGENFCLVKFYFWWNFWRILEMVNFFKTLL